MEWILESPDDLPALIPELLQALEGRRKIALYGPMGAGKTSLVKAICQHLGVRENTASPTFSLVNQYSYVEKDGSTSLFQHLDLYRLRSAQEAFDMGMVNAVVPHKDLENVALEWAREMNSKSPLPNYSVG